MNNTGLIILILVILIAVVYFMQRQPYTEGFNDIDGKYNPQMEQLRYVGSGRVNMPLDVVGNSGGLANFNYTTIDNRGGNGENWIPRDYTKYQFADPTDPFDEVPESELTNELIYGDYTQYPYYPTWRIEQPESWGLPQQTMRQQVGLAELPVPPMIPPSNRMKVQMANLPIMDLPMSGEAVNQLPRDFKVSGKYNRPSLRQSSSNKKYYVMDQLPMPFEGASDSDDGSDGGSDDGIRNLRADLFPCSKKCCETSWSVPFDGLTSKQVMDRIEFQSGNLPTVIMEMPDGRVTEFIKTNYNCGGMTDAGCPCVPKKAYKAIANRGNNTQLIDEPDPTFVVKYGVDRIADASPDQDYLTPYQKIQSQYSSFIRNRRMNDVAKETPNARLDLVSGVPADF